MNSGNRTLEEEENDSSQGNWEKRSIRHIFQQTVKTIDTHLIRLWMWQHIGNALLKWRVASIVVLMRVQRLKNVVLLGSHFLLSMGTTICLLRRHQCVLENLILISRRWGKREVCASLDVEGLSVLLRRANLLMQQAVLTEIGVLNSRDCQRIWLCLQSDTDWMTGILRVHRDLVQRERLVEGCVYW